MVVHAFNPSTSGGRGRWVSEFEASLVYGADFGTAWVTQGNPVLGVRIGGRNGGKKRRRKKQEEREGEGVERNWAWHEFLKPKSPVPLTHFLQQGLVS